MTEEMKSKLVKGIKYICRNRNKEDYKKALELHNEIPRDLKFYEINSGLSKSTIQELIDKAPIQYFYIMLNQIARHIDLKLYKNHIRNSKEFWCLDEKLKPTLIEPCIFPNYWKIDAVFRKRHECVAACLILKEFKEEKSIGK